MSADGRELWEIAAPPSVLFADAHNGMQGLDPGSVTDLQLQPGGTSTGSIEPLGIPRGRFDVRLRCVVGGEINTADTINPSATALPSFAASADAGVTYFRTQVVTCTRDEAEIVVSQLGLRFRFRNGGAAPSFVAGEVWSCSTEPSRDIVALIPPLCASMDKYLGGSFDLPFLEYSPDFTLHLCSLLRWELIKKIGVSEKMDVTIYKPTEAMEWLKHAQRGDFAKPAQQGVKETPPGVSFPSYTGSILSQSMCREFKI